MIASAEVELSTPGETVVGQERKRMEVVPVIL